MTVSLLVSCLVVAYIVPAVTFTLVIARRPQLIVCFLVACFLAVVTYFISSLLWVVVPLPRDRTVSLMILFHVILVEVSRFLYVAFYKRARLNFAVVGTNAIAFPLVQFYTALSAGVGFGATITLLTYGDFIINGANVGAIFAEGDCGQHMSSYFSAALMSLFLNIVHVALFIIAFEAYMRSSPPVWMSRYFICFIIHALVMLCPVFTEGFGSNVAQCQLPHIINLILTVIAVALALLTVAQPSYSSNKRVEYGR